MNKIKQFLRCYAHGMGLKSISSVLSVSRNTVRRYMRIYQECGVSLEHLLTMQDEHLRDMLFGSNERVHTPTHKEVVLQELLPEYAKRLCRKDQNKAIPLKELELERRLVQKITTFIMELGSGFSFIGNQHTLTCNNKEYRVDLLFFHRRLRSMVAIELKIGEFKPEYVGKMNFYLSLLDKLEKAPDENPSIGIILCAEKDHLEVELALQDVNKPIGVAEYQYLLPKNKLQELVTDEIKKSQIKIT